MPGASSTRSISPTHRRPRPKPSSESPRSTPSKPRYAAARLKPARPSVRPGQNLCSPTCSSGSKPHSRSSPASPTQQRRSATLSRVGRPSRVTSTMAHWRSTTTPPNVRCASSRSDEKTSSSVDRTPEGNGPQPSTRSSDQPSSTDSIRSSISTTSSNASPTTPSTGSTTSCHGT